MPYPQVVTPVLAFFVILVVKFSMNLSYFLRCKRHLVQYTEDITAPGWGIDQRKSEIVKLFKRAGIKEATIGVADPVGYGYLRTGDASVFDNLSMQRQDIVGIVMMMFHQAIGTYRARMWETLNPLYWIETILYLPRELMTYLGVPSDNTIVRVIQLVYWFASVVSASLVLYDRIG